MLHRFFSRLTPLGGQSLRKSLVALCFLIPLLTQAQNQHRFEGPVEVARWITTHFAQGKLPPFSFYYNERPSAEFIRKWQYKAEKLASDDPAVLRYLYTYRDPATGLLLECQVKGFTDFQAVEWVIKFTNTSSVNTPKIRDVKVVDLALEDRRTSGFDLLYLEGVHCFGSRSDFRPHYTALEPGKSLLRIRVNDTTDSGVPGKRAMWEQDCVELFVDAAPRILPETHAESYQPATFRLFIMPRLEKEKQLVFWGDRGFVEPDSIGCRVTADASGYEILLEFPEKA